MDNRPIAEVKPMIFHINDDSDDDNDVQMDNTDAEDADDEMDNDDNDNNNNNAEQINILTQIRDFINGLIANLQQA